MTTNSSQSPHRRQRAIRCTLPLVLVAALTLPVACSKKQPQQEIPPRPVKVAAAIEKDIPLYIENFGNLVSPNNVNIVSQVTGKILSVHFAEGDAVKKGDLLFSIDPREYQADLDKSKASLEACPGRPEVEKRDLRSEQAADREEADLPAGLRHLSVRR